MSKCQCVGVILAQGLSSKGIRFLSVVVADFVACTACYRALPWKAECRGFESHLGQLFFFEKKELSWV